jgi:penicillin-binding protein 1A
MCQMMQGTVDRGTAAGLRARLGAAEMGGKTGTTNDNTDGWFMGYTPQLLGGVWIGCDNNFIRLQNNLGYGGEAARPIWEYFFKKVFADKSLGIDKEARFNKPAEIENEINSADPIFGIDAANPGAEGEDQGVGSEKDFQPQTNEYIGPESQPVKDENNNGKVDKRDTGALKSRDPKIGEGQEKKPEKKGFLKRLFGKKDKQ